MSAHEKTHVHNLQRWDSHCSVWPKVSLMSNQVKPNEG